MQKRETFTKEIQEEYGNINGIIVYREGKTAYESYFNGFQQETAGHVASVTKTILSALIGIAIDKGYIKGVRQKIRDFFPELTTGAFGENNCKNSITIEHLLTMTVPYPYPDWQEPFAQLCMQPNWTEFILGMLGDGGQLGDFKYSTSGAHLLSVILTRSTGKSAREFANEFLFGPLEMKEIPDYPMAGFDYEDLFGARLRGWPKDPQGNATGGWGLHLTLRDMARVGLLYLNEGMWEGETVLSKEWVRASTTMNINHYGYLWWLREENGVFSYSAMGDGGNMICCIPEKQMVVGILSTVQPSVKDRWLLIEKYML